MRKIESFQMKKIYAIGHALGITGTGSEDELHVLVSSVTGKDSIKELSYQEAMAVIKRLEDLQGGTAAPKPSSRKPKEHSQRPGGVTSGQQKKIWVTSEAVISILWSCPLQARFRSVFSLSAGL